MLAVTADRFPAGGATMYAILAAFGNAGGTVSLAIGITADRASLRLAVGSVAACPLLLVLLLAWPHYRSACARGNRAPQRAEESPAG